MRDHSSKWCLLLLLLFFLLASSEPERSSAPMDKVEQEALYMVIQGFVGKWWNGSDLYPDPCGWTQIQGVSCDLFDGLWCVTGINIGPVLENSLECNDDDANFSPLLFELKHLKSLSFFDCFGSHRQITIPSSNWEKLGGSLESLEFRSNKGLIESIPANLGQLASLQSLVLIENSLSGQLPQELVNLVHLKKLVLSGNRFSGGIPSSLGNNLSELLILDLSSNTLSGNLPSSLGCLTSLLKLDLSNNLFNGSLPPELGGLRSLTLLDLRNNIFSGGLPQSFQGMVSLQDLFLSNNSLGGSLLTFDWESLANLTNLELSDMGLTGTIPESIASLKRLRFLALDNNNLTGTVSPKLAALPSLTSLYLNGNNLTGQLGFSKEFYKRMGRRFSSWDNPNLCYTSVGMTKGDLPYGVQQCKKEQETSKYNSDSNDRVYKGSQDQSSSLLPSVGFSASTNTGYWWGLVVGRVVIVFLLIMLL